MKLIEIFVEFVEKDWTSDLGAPTNQIHLTIDLNDDPNGRISPRTEGNNGGYPATI